MMASKINQKEYLKKYLSGDKKKKRGKTIKNAKVKIIDEDNDVQIEFDTNEELLLMGEDAPQIVGVIDERPPNEAECKWRAIGAKTTTQTKRIDELQEKNISNRAYNESRSAQHRSPERPHRRMKSTDLSPRRRRNEDFSPKRKKVDDDYSPPRKRSINKDRNKDLKNSPPNHRSGRNNDQSPKRRNYALGNKSPPRKCNSYRDLSPSRRRSCDKLHEEKSNRFSDISPPRRNQNVISSTTKSDRDTSVSRRIFENSTLHKPSENQLRETKPISGKLRKPSRFSDYSPPRKIKVEPNSLVNETISSKSFSQSSPQTCSSTSRRSSDLSPKRRNPLNIKKSSDRQTHDTDYSPVRKNHRNPFRDNLSQRNEDKNRKMTKTLDGKTAGLQDAKTLKAESVMLRAKEDLEFAKLSVNVSGRNAEIQVRKNRAYKNRRIDEIDEEAERQKDEREKQKQEVYSRWGKGLKQIEAYENKVANETHESSKPLARYSNDEDLDDMLKKQERDGDPMLEYLRRKERENAKQKGNELEIPKFQGSYPENRFNIRPGYRWDRLDRSNGYEKRWFDAQNQKKAMQEEAYKYSTEDL